MVWIYPWIMYPYLCLPYFSLWLSFTREKACTAHFHPHANTQTSFSTNHSQIIHTLNKQIHGQKLHSHTHAISGITIISFQKQLIRVMILKMPGVEKSNLLIKHENRVFQPRFKLIWFFQHRQNGSLHLNRRIYRWAGTFWEVDIRTLIGSRQHIGAACTFKPRQQAFKQEQNSMKSSLVTQEGQYRHRLERKRKEETKGGP